MYGNRGPTGLRTLQGLLHLARRHPVTGQSYRLKDAVAKRQKAKTSAD